ncbi:MAG: cadherin-like domain-containing protein [Methylococcaceae bacterium]|nr:cadherin-like domain-containing protein [Methylococcaceae bacterium]
MIPIKIDFPVFEANQVLTSDHLNCMRIYLDEQSRLTRATLHGIGVVCGLTISVTSSDKIVTLGKGYGVTSEGYLAMVGNEDFVAKKYQKYKVPEEDGYALLLNAGSEASPLLELLDEGHDDYANGTPLAKAILENKVVLLFVELLEENLKNCSPSSCDDKGKKVTVTLRKLLIDKTALETLNTTIKANIEKAKAQGDFFPDLTARLDLPDLRLPRLDLLPGNLANAQLNAQTIFVAYQKILSKNFFGTVGNALDEAYLAFQPILSTLPGEHYLSQKLTTIYTQYESTQKVQGVIYSQYFYDFLDDIIQAYDEFRWKALDFMALCSPPAEVFPRHLELGEIYGENFAGHKIHRHYFRPSPALTEQKMLGSEVQQLFLRLKLMLEQFEFPKNPMETTPKSVVKIIPSCLGGTPLSEKAIPYYYPLSKTPPLLTSWNFHKTRVGRASQNMGYNVETQYHRYINTPVEPLNYDLENYNFFRIEGHIGLKWRDVLTDLLEKIALYRLPFDVIALNAHPEAVASNPLVSSCLDNDLQVIYDAWAKELECLLKEKIKIITNILIPLKISPTIDKTVPTKDINILKNSAKINILSSLSRSEGSLGMAVSTAINKKSVTSITSVKLKNSVNELLKENSDVGKLSVADYELTINKPVDVVSALVDFSNSLPVNASDLQYVSISNKYQELTKTITDYRKNLAAYQIPPKDAVITPEQKDQALKTLDELLYNCLIERLEELGAELERRKKQIEELIFFSKYVRKHPGLEHKAGVSKGGTFVLVFQETPTTIDPVQGSFITNKLNGALKISAVTKIALSSAANLSTLKLTTGEQKILLDTLKNQGINLPEEALSKLGITRPGYIVPKIFDIPERVVIADFFLPYRCCSSCPPVQFVLPPPRPIFVLHPECQSQDGKAQVRFEFSYRTPPCEVQIDDLTYTRLTDDQIKLSVGKHKVVVRDAEGGVSLPQEIEIFPRFSLEPGKPVCNDSNETYTVKIKVTNGQLPINIDGKKVETTNSDTPNSCFIAAGPFNSGETVKIMVGDSSICPAQELTFTHTCIPLQPEPDTAKTEYKTPVTINVLDNDAGSELALTEAKLNNPLQGVVVINAGKTITYTPDSTVENQDVVINYTVKDSYGRSANETATVHVGKKPCDLPCKGIAVRRGYRFLLYATSLELKSRISFSFEFPQGSTIDLSEEVQSILQEFAGDGESFAKQINSLIAKKTGRPDWLKFEYGSSEPDSLDIWWIEYFECLQFEFQMSWPIGIVTRQVPITTITVTPTASTIVSTEGEKILLNVTIPAFDGFKIDKCNLRPQPKPLCTQELDLALEISPPQVDGLTVNVNVTPSGSDKPVAYLWEVQDGNPPISNGQQASFTFTQLEPATKLIRLTAFTKKGCRVIQEVHTTLSPPPTPISVK